MRNKLTLLLLFSRIRRLLVNGCHWNWIWFHLDSDMVSQLDLDLVFSLDSEMFFIGIGFSSDWNVFHWLWFSSDLDMVS